jgi:hypothetical protein
VIAPKLAYLDLFALAGHQRGLCQESETHGTAGVVLKARLAAHRVTKSI